LHKIGPKNKKNINFGLLRFLRFFFKKPTFFSKPFSSPDVQLQLQWVSLEYLDELSDYWLELTLTVGPSSS